MQYRCVAKSVEGFLQQLVANYISTGYLFYVTGQVPEGKDPRALDEKIIEKYGLSLSTWARARRKRAGFANVQYLRYGRFFVIIATHGRHQFFEKEGGQVRDVRHVSIKFAGYSISRRRSFDGSWRTHVRMDRESYAGLKAHMVELARQRTVENLTSLLRAVPFEPYAPVRRQLLNILRAMNRERKAAGFEPVPMSALRFKRRIVKPFGEGREAA
jgi:hypothetical protein